jgi:hypothetical protein
MAVSAMFVSLGPPGAAEGTVTPPAARLASGRVT